MHAVETMAYVQSNGVPWHGLGNPIPQGATIEQMLKASGLDWKVNLRYVRMKEGKDLESFVPIPGFVAVVRDTDNKVYQIASDRYKPVQNATIMEQFREHIEAGGMHLDTAGSLKEGAVVWAMASLGKGFTLPGGDVVTGNLLYSTSHDGSLVTEAKFVSTRVVCWNTLSAARGEKGTSYRLKHSTKFDAGKQREAKEVLGLALNRLQKLEAWANKLADCKIAKQQALTFVQTLTNPGWFEEVIQKSEDLRSAEINGGNLLDLVIAESASTKTLKPPTENDLNRVGKAILESIIDSPGSDLPSAKGTAWGLVNGVTYYTDHIAGRSQDNRLTSSWFGQRENLKEEAFDLALKVAKAA